MRRLTIAVISATRGGLLDTMLLVCAFFFVEHTISLYCPSFSVWCVLCVPIEYCSRGGQKHAKPTLLSVILSTDWSVVSQFPNPMIMSGALCHRKKIPTGVCLVEKRSGGILRGLDRAPG